MWLFSCWRWLETVSWFILWCVKARRKRRRTSSSALWLSVISSSPSSASPSHSCRTSLQSGWEVRFGFNSHLNWNLALCDLVLWVIDCVSYGPGRTVVSKSALHQKLWSHLLEHLVQYTYFLFNIKNLKAERNWCTMTLIVHIFKVPKTFWLNGSMITCLTSTELLCCTNRSYSGNKLKWFF